MNEIKTIILTSNEPWGDIWYSKQHYAFELSKLGYKVFFINPCSRWKIKNIFSNKIKVQQINPNLFTVDYNNYLPQFILERTHAKLNDRINIKRLSKKLQLGAESVLFWKFDPFRFSIPLKHKNIRNIFHVVDPYFHFWQNKPSAIHSDLVVVINKRLYDKYDFIREEKKLIIPHGISNDEKEISQSEVENLKNKYGNYFIYVGNLSNDIDTDLFKAVIEKHKILVIGNNSFNVIEKELLNHPNCKFLGIKKSKELNNYIAASIGGLILYKFPKQDNSIVRTPLKALNYLAQNKPIITSINTNIPELLNLAIFQAKDKENFIELLNKINSGEIIVDEEKTNEYLSSVQYSKLIERILNKLTSI